MKSRSSQKTREPYGKVTEVGQVPVALQEIMELSTVVGDLESANRDLKRIRLIADSIIAVTCANPGCLSQMAESMEVKS